MMMKKIKTGPTRAQIRAMSPEERDRHYQQEKNDLFYHLKNMSAAEISEMHEAIRKKWMV